MKNIETALSLLSAKLNLQKERVKIYGHTLAVYGIDQAIIDIDDALELLGFEDLTERDVTEEDFEALSKRASEEKEKTESRNFADKYEKALFLHALVDRLNYTLENSGVLYYYYELEHYNKESWCLRTMVNPDEHGDVVFDKIDLDSAITQTIALYESKKVET